MNIKRMDLGWVTTADIKKAEKFFVNTLGLTVTTKIEGGWLELKAKEGEFTLGVGQVRDHSPVYETPGNNAVLTLSVDDIVNAKAELESKGVMFFGDIIEVPGHVKMATFADPDSNVFQLVQTL